MGGTRGTCFPALHLLLHFLELFAVRKKENELSFSRYGRGFTRTVSLRRLERPGGTFPTLTRLLPLVSAYCVIPFPDEITSGSSFFLNMNLV